jgi:hypothetical protein
LVDTLGLLIGVYICGGNISEKAGAKKLLSGLKHQKPSLSLCGRVWVDDIEDLIYWICKQTLAVDLGGYFAFR